MKLPKDLLTQNYTKPNIYLCETDKTKICKLETTDTKAILRFNSYSELECSIARVYEDIIDGEQKINPFYDKIEALRLLYVEGFGYFQIQDPEIFNDGIQEVKNITAYSLEYSLSQRYLENFNVNAGGYNSIEVICMRDKNGDGEINSKDVESIVFYNPNAFTEYDKKHSLLHLILENAYGWRIGHVDASLRTMSRKFEVSRISIYDFIMNDICDKFNCFVVFDTTTKDNEGNKINTINFYAESPIAKFIGDGSTTEFTIIPPFDSIDTVSINSYKTTKYVYNKETGVLTFDEAPEKPSTNTANIEVVDGSQKKYSTDVYVTFDNLAKEVSVSYSADAIKTVLSVKGADNLDIREVNMGVPYITDLSYYYSVDWMGQDLYDAYGRYLEKSTKHQDKYIENAEKMLDLDGHIDYEEHRLSLKYSVAEHVNDKTVGKYYVRGGTEPDYYYTEVQLPSEYSAKVEHYYSLSGNDLDETKMLNLYSALQKYYVSKDEKTVEDIEKLEEFFVFMDAYTIKQLSEDLKNSNTTEDKDKYVRKFLDLMWEQVGRTPLIDLYKSAYVKKKEVNVEQGWDKEDNENYWRYYPVTVILDSIELAISIRTEKINGYQNEYNTIQKENADLTSGLNLVNNFTEKQLIRLNSFWREDEYTDDNFIVTDADTIDSSIKTKKELLECGRIELAKLCEPKLEFSMDMANIYALHEFEPIVSQFQLGNLINIEIRPKTKTQKAYIKRSRMLEVNINFDDFSDFSCEFGELTGLQTQSSIHADLLANALQAGKSVASNTSYWDKGADLATSTDIKIQQGLLSAISGLYTADQSIVIDNNGILLRKVNEDGTFSPNQLFLTNNTILYSTDGFENAETGFGEFNIAGNTIYGVLADGVYAGYIESSDIIGGTINIGDGTFVVNSDGSVVMNAASINGYAKEDGIISSINQSPETIAINANRISLAGKTIGLTSDNITIDSTNFSVDKNGKITATSGEIAGWTIYPGLLRKETTIDGVDYQIYMQSTDGVSTSNAFVVRKKNSSDTSWDYQFSVNYEGRLVAKNANITGTITAEDGSIAGYNIGPGGSYSNALYKRVSGDASDYEVGIKASSGDTDLAFYVKESTDNWSSSSNTFYIRNNGQLYAQNAVITGEVNASSGKIGGWTIGSMGGYTGSIYSTVCEASTPSSSNPEYAVFMRGNGASASNIAIAVKKRTSSSTSWVDAEETFYVLKNGHVKMADADVTGKINASSGNISGNLDISGALTNTQGDYTVTLRGVQSDVGKGVFYITDNSSGSAEYPVRINGDGSARFTNVTITGSSTIASACIPNLSAAKITSGTLDPVRIPNLSADKITTGVLEVGRIPNLSAGKITSGTISTSLLDASVITTGNFSSKTLSTSNLTVASGCRLGVASEYNALIRTVGDYTYIRGYGPDTNYETSFYNLVKYVVQNSSNKDIKNEIHDFDDRYDVFFDKLNPQLFKYNFEPNMGYTMGYIWQETEQARIESGLERNDIGAITETDSVVGGLALSKQDFIALNTWQIQKLKDRVAELEKKLAALEG